MADSLTKQIGRYFNLGAIAPRPIYDPDATPPPPKPADWLPQYVAVALGVAAEPFLHTFIATKHWFGTTTPDLIPQTFFGLIMAVLIFPGVYKSSFDPANPRFVQFSAIFASGIGWQSLFSTASKAVAG
ncbi:hypothetical protein GRI89_02825 [Altererythrobacter salegens]|uniref:Uncharacterized protein n=1 Tax=Croceibacterium salegens TaxID=1737568 RepID=A0A6I4SR84_9SPHN|nr:hypothetical protein [Croceibacterium salegens]MXO58481.1 hypothetical protein [Croceibacterium salegens]